MGEAVAVGRGVFEGRGVVDGFGGIGAVKVALEVGIIVASSEG